MSTAKLNVWVTKVGDACKIDNEHQWYVHILHCDGELLRWCDRTYSNLATKCGHLEIEIPPGCYMVCATWSPAPAGQIAPTSLGNHISHLVSIRAECGEESCVTLFPPTFHFCGIWWLIALREHLSLNQLPREAGAAAQNALQAVEELLKHVPADEFTQRMLRIQEQRPEPPQPARGKRQK